MARRTDDLLVDELRELGRRLAVPDAPDLRSAVLDRLAAPRPAQKPVRRFAFTRWPVRRRLIAVASAVLVCALVAVSPARAAVVDAVDGLLRFAGIEIRPERGNPDLSAPSPLASSRHAGLDEARRLAKFPVQVPDLLGAPERVSVADPGPDGAPRVVSLFYHGGTVRLDEFDGHLEPVFMKQAEGAEWVTIGGHPGLWIAAPHPVTYIDRTGAVRVETARLAGPALIWENSTASFRLEGVATREEAQRIAASLSG